VNGAIFIGRLASPIDEFISPAGESAADQVKRGVKSAINYGNKVAADPSIAKADAKGIAAKIYEGIEPSATPVAPTLAEEIQRRQRLGMNQGEAAFDVASILYGGPAVKGLTAFPRAVEELAAADRLIAASSPRAAERLARPYSGAGSHFVARRHTRAFPAFVRDNPLFVYKPDGLSQIEFYRRHYKLDPFYQGGPLPGGAGWSGKKMGWKKFGQFDRVAFGMPAPTRAAAIANAGGATRSLFDFGEEEEAP
jgi:hypothetical protein